MMQSASVALAICYARGPVINDDQCLSEDISMKTTRPKQSLSLRMA